MHPLVGNTPCSHCPPLSHVIERRCRPSFSSDLTYLDVANKICLPYNAASTMVALMCASPVRGLVDLSSLRLVSCGGSPLAAAVVKRAIGTFGCEFFVSYGRSWQYCSPGHRHAF